MPKIKVNCYLKNHESKILEFNAFFQDGEMIHSPNKMTLNRAGELRHFIKRGKKIQNNKVKT